jgi:virulence factor Mce-like protein
MTPGSVVRLAIASLLGAAAVSGCGGSAADSDSSIDAIFPNASGVGKGQDVRIAGAPVGSVTGVRLTPDRRARVSMRIDPQFLPFRRDGGCTIEPQSLIGEKFVNCDPGTPGARPLATEAGDTPMIPLARNSSPVELDQVVAMLGQPVNVRFQLLLNEFGAGFTTRGEDLSTAIRRAVPTLQYARDTTRIVGRDRDALKRLLAATNTVVGALAASRTALGDSFQNGATTLAVTSQYRTQLDRAIRLLPPTLGALKPVLRSLQRLTADGAPTLAAIRRATPAVRRLADDLPPLARAARPVLSRVSDASAVGAPVFRRLQPQLRLLERDAESLAPATDLAGRLTPSLRANAVPESLLKFLYNGGLAISRFNSKGHIVGANVIAPLSCFPLALVDTAPGCSARFADDTNGQTEARSADAGARR